MANSNGTNGTKLGYWLIGLLVPLLVGVSTSIFGTIRSNTERIGVLESEVHNTKVQLERIEHKLDRLIERSHRKDP
jgi:hypothetical protein